MTKPVRVTTETTIEALLAALPAAAPVFVARRMHCVGCEIAAFDTVADACHQYGQPITVVLQELRRAARQPGHHEEGPNGRGCRTRVHR